MMTLRDVEAATITIVRGLDVDDLDSVLRFVPASGRSATFEEALFLQDVHAWPVQVEGLPDGLVVVEPNGFLTTIRETAQALSRRGSSTSVFWNVNAVMKFQLAEQGKMTRLFDPLFRYEDAGTGAPLREEQGLFASSDEDPRGAALELLRRLTGVGVTHDWLLSPTRRTWLAQY